MRTLLVVLLIVFLVGAGCINLKNPGGVKENKPASEPLGKTDSTVSQPSTSSSDTGQKQGAGQSGSNAGQMQSMPGSGQQGSSDSLPSLQGSGQSGSISGFSQPGSSSITAGNPVSQGMAEFKKPYPYDTLGYGGHAIKADKEVINPGEAVFLLCDIENATSIIVTDREGNKWDVPVNKRGLFVVPKRSTTYTVTASNPAGSITDSLNVTVDFTDVGLYKDGKLQPEFTTFTLLRFAAGRGQSTWLFWNTRSAEDVYIWDSVFGQSRWDDKTKLAWEEKTDERFRQLLWGAREVYPPNMVWFVGTCINKKAYDQQFCVLSISN